MFVPSPAMIFAGFEAVIGGVILLVSFIGWLVKLVNDKNRKPAKVMPPRRKPRPLDNRFQNEIDIFLKDVDGKQPLEEVGIELVPEDEIRQRRQEDPDRLEIGTLAGRSLGSNRLGSGVEQSVDRHMHDHSVAEHVSEDLDGGIGDFEPAKERAAAPTTHKHTANIARREETRKLIQRLRNPVGVRQAILISEILNPCRGLRPRK